MLARTGVASAGALNVSFLRLRSKSGLSGYDNISDIHFEYTIDLPETNFVLASLIHD